MKDKITSTPHIRQQLELLHQQKYKSEIPLKKLRIKHKGLGLNWRDAVIFTLFLIFVGLYQINA